MLDDEDGVADVAQVVQQADEALAVARVQADGRLVEDVERADERGAEIRGELDALRLAARKRGGEAVERQVVEADVDEELRRRRISKSTLSAMAACSRQLERLEKLRAS